MAMFVYDDNKVFLKPENASPMLLSNMLQCKAVGMVLVDQVCKLCYYVQVSDNLSPHV